MSSLLSGQPVGVFDQHVDCDILAFPLVKIPQCFGQCQQPARFRRAAGACQQRLDRRAAGRGGYAEKCETVFHVGRHRMRARRIGLLTQAFMNFPGEYNSIFWHETLVAVKYHLPVIPANPYVFRAGCDSPPAVKL